MAMSDEPIVIRRAETADDYRACQQAQRRAWGITEDGYVVPVATMVGAQHHGGLVLGAFLPSGEAVGLSFSFLGRTGGTLCLYSQLTGVDPSHQSRGIGARLKADQREFAQAEGLELIAWAFDPLQAGNAHFNLEVLGASIGRYIENMYGTRTDTLNAGAPTDRVIAEWPTSDPILRPETRTPDARAASMVREAVWNEPWLRLEIPADIAALRVSDPAAAKLAREIARDGFLAAFAHGYRAVGFQREDAHGARRCFYLFSPGPA